MNTEDSPNNTLPKPVLGDEVATEVLQWIGAFRTLGEALIITYTMQDYEFWGHGRISDLLKRQLAFGAKIIVMTTPPPGNGNRQPFKDKFSLLEDLVRSGVDVFLHEDLHAKAYLFTDDQEAKVCIVGSANLTGGGFGSRDATIRSLLELALLTYDSNIHNSTEEIIRNRLLGDQDTEDFGTWQARNLDKISRARGGP